MKRFFIILAILSFGCAATESVPVGMTKEQVSTEQEAIKAMIDQLAITWNEEDLKKYCSLWAYNSKIITGDGETFNIRCVNNKRVIEEWQYLRLRGGKIKYDIKWVKLKSSTTANGLTERTCATCSKTRGIGKAPVKFEFVKNNGQWLVRSQDFRR